LSTNYKGIELLTL